MYYIILTLFFFQAEDGIRDLVRSRGLGDVYKRQEQYRTEAGTFLEKSHLFIVCLSTNYIDTPKVRWAVSYTHLTLPTSDLV